MGRMVLVDAEMGVFDKGQFLTMISSSSWHRPAVFRSSGQNGLPWSVEYLIAAKIV